MELKYLPLKINNEIIWSDWTVLNHKICGFLYYKGKIMRVESSLEDYKNKVKEIQK